MNAVNLESTSPWKWVSSAGLVVCASFVGYFGWSEHLLALAAVSLIPALWSLASSRFAAGIILLAYYLAAARSMPHGLGVYFGDSKPDWFGYVMWLLTAFLLALPWLLLWTKDICLGTVTWRLPLILALTALPPLGFFGWAHPLTAAGALFPGWGWWGLATLVAGMIASCLLRGRAAAGLALTFGVILTFSTSKGMSPNHSQSWRGADTQFGGQPRSEASTAGNLDYLMRAFSNNQSMMQRAKAISQGSTVILFPESMAGPWSQATQNLWKDVSAGLKSHDTTVLTGAEEFHPAGGYDNVIVALGAEEGVKYRQRMPVPVAMWNPFSDKGAVAHWRSTGVFEMAGRRVAGLICFEQLLVWPVLISMANGAQIIVAPANMWWSSDTDLPAIQHTAVAAWARLFAVPLVTAFNTAS